MILNQILNWICVLGVPQWALHLCGWIWAMSSVSIMSLTLGCLGSCPSISKHLHSKSFLGKEVSSLECQCSKSLDPYLALPGLSRWGGVTGAQITAMAVTELVVWLLIVWPLGGVLVITSCILWLLQIKRPYFHVKPLEKIQLKNWKEYLEFEIENGTHERVVVLFERCVISCALYEDFWIKEMVCLQPDLTAAFANCVASLRPSLQKLV